MKRSHVALLAAALWLAAPAAAQEVRWEDPGMLGAGQRTSLDLVFADTEPANSVVVPHVDGLTVLGPPSHRSQVSVVNGTTTASVTLSYPVRADAPGEIEIPAFQVKTADGVQSVAGLTLEVGEPTLPAAARGGRANVPANEVVSAELRPSTRTPYAGEVFNVDLTVGLAAGRRGEIASAPAWTDRNVVAEAFGDGKRVEMREGGAGVRLRARAMAPAPGSFELQPVRQQVRVETGRQRADPFGSFRQDMLADVDRFFEDSFADDFFGRAQLSEVAVESSSAALDVQPLPQSAPAGFSGAVGQFELESKLVPQDAKTGDPVTWTLSLRGTGNWPGGVSLPARAIPVDLRTLQPKQQRAFDEGALFTGAASEDIVMIPPRAGDYRFEPVRFVYFDPKQQQFETIVAEPPVLHVTGASLAATTNSPAAEDDPGAHVRDTHDPGADVRGAPAAGRQAAQSAADPGDAAATDFALAEPLEGAGLVLAPMSRDSWLRLLAAPFAALAIYWIALAYRQSRRTDPRQIRRTALTRLAAAVEAVHSEPERRREALLEWQHAAAVLLDLDLAAPTPAQLGQRPGIDREWIALWAESDRVLYGPDADIEATWCGRARTIARRLRRTRHNPLRALLPTNLLPQAAAAALVLCVGSSAGASPSPADWVGRYNLAIAHARAGETTRALGETAAAFLGRPSNDRVRHNLSLLAAAVPGTDATLARLAARTGGAGFASLLAPALWQILAVAGVVLFCGGTAAALWRSYTARAALAPGIAAVLSVSLLLTLAGVYSIREYGHLADPKAAILAQPATLRSVPTDAETASGQRALEPGTSIIAERSFLGWTKVALPEGDSGWVRSEILVPLYS